MFRQEIGCEMIWPIEMMGGAVTLWLVGEQRVDEKQREKKMKERVQLGICQQSSWCVGWGRCVVFLSKKPIWESLQLGISV